MIRRWLPFGLLLFCWLGLTGLAQAQQEALAGPESQNLNRPKFLILALDQIFWQDYFDAEAPAFKELREDGAVGLMVARTAGPHGSGGFLTIGAGARLREGRAPEVADQEGFAFHPWERTRFGPAGEFYTWLTGESADAAAIVHLALPSIINSNADLDYLAQPGLLGETLKQSGVRVACLGNADLPGHRYRPAAAMAMDAKGQIPLGEVGEQLLEKGFPPQTSAAALLAAFDQLAPQADFLVIDYGDFGRIGQTRALLSPEMAQRRRREAVARADIFLSALLGKMSGRPWRLLVITPNLSPEGKGGRLTPIILYGDKVPAGWLTSASTRIWGLVTNTDIAPTVLDFFQLKSPEQMLGRPLQARQEEKLPTAKIAALQKEISRREILDSQKRLLTRPVMILLMISFGLCGGVFLFGPRLSAGIGKVLRGLCLGLLAWPLAMTLLGIGLPAPPAASFGLMLAGSGLLAWLAVKGAGNKISPVILLAAATGVVLAGDLLLPGQPLMHYSPLSYFPSEGSRYYGIGNELGGVFLPAFLIALSGLWGKRGREARLGQGALMLIAIGLLGSGRWGANFGMTLAAAAACFAIIFLSFAPGSIWRKVGGVALLAAVAGLIILELLQEGGASHLGTAARELEQSGQGQLLGTIFRKLAMNWKLLQNSLWAEVLAFALGLIIILALEPRRRLSDLLKSQPGLRLAFWASLVGGAGAFIFNDSGTVAGALIFSYTALWLSYFLLPKAGKFPRPTTG